MSLCPLSPALPRPACSAAGYFDVRDLQERWVRVWMRRGMMLVLPEGIYHRFTLDEANYIKVRGWVGGPACGWVQAADV